MNYLEDVSISKLITLIKTAIAKNKAAIAENKVAAKQESGVVLYSGTEEMGENQSHHKQHQQGREYTPAHAKHRSFVFLFKITAYQLFNKKLVLFKLF